MVTEKELRELKAGDIVTLNINDGVEAEIVRANHQNDKRVYIIFKEGCTGLTYYYNNGGKYSSYNEGFEDIIAIKKAPFDWADVKHGMGFKNKHSGYIYLFVGFDPEDDDTVHFRDVERASCDFFCISDDSLERMPEHDIISKLDNGDNNE